MWKREKEPVVNPIKEVTSVSTMPQERKVEMAHETLKNAVAHIGKSVLIKGELSGSEDLYIDGQVEGTIELRDHNLTIGPNGRVQANVNAKEVVILGSLKGNVRAVDRVEIRKAGSLVGDLVAARVVVEDGADIKGSIDIQKPELGAKPPEPRKTEPAPLSESFSKLASVPIEAKKLH